MRQFNSNQRIEARGVLNASGALTLAVSCPLGPAWNVKQIAIKGNSTLEPTCQTFIGSNSAGVFISNSFTGNADTDDQPNVTLRPGDSLCAVWAGGTAGASMTLTVIYDETAA